MTDHLAPQQPVRRLWQHASWWQRPASMAVLVAASVALGLWVYTASAPQPASRQAPVDAVQQVLRLGKPTIIEFGANNCVSCREMKPVLHALAKDSRIAVADVDILKERYYIRGYQIRLMPTQVFFDANGKEISRHLGKISGTEILAQLGFAPDGPMPGNLETKAPL